jgi:eukaryotic-like serine/threonine-protein kinase
MTLRANERLGPYEILGGLGAGGMGEVYRARDPRLGRTVAIKVLRSDAAHDPDRLQRFEQEARTSGGLNHPNVVAVYDVGTHEGAPYLVTELLEGETLRQRLESGAPPLRKAIDWALQIARGLAAAHDGHVVHRDLKPENLFVSKDGIVKILDFGLARLERRESGASPDATATVTHRTDPGVVLGTVGYMSPEQVRGEAADHRSDIFALGAIAYEMLAGRRAFRGDTSVESMNAILKEEPAELPAERPIPPALDRLVRHCLEKRPEDRFQSARDVAFELEGLAASATSSDARRPDAATRRWRRWLWAAALAAATGALVAGAFVAGRQTAPQRIPTYRQITFGRGLAPSGRFTSDGKTVIYGAAWNGGPPEIYSVAIDALESKHLGLPKGHVAAVSPKGELAILLTTEPVLADRPAMLARVPLLGGVPRPVAEGVWCADWAPDGESLAFHRSVDDRDQIEFPLGRVLATGQVGCPRFSPDGRRLAYSVPEGYEVIELATDRRFRVTGVSELGHEWWWAWSRDGEEIWVSASDAVNERPIRAVSMDGRQRVVGQVAGTATLYDVSRDGLALIEHAFAWWHTRVRAPGGRPERDLSLLDHTVPMDISADGRTVLLKEWGASGIPDVYLRATDGSPPMRLGRGTGCALAPDGRSVIVLPERKNVPYKTWGPTPLVIVPTGAGPQRTVPLARMEVRWATWLPDGEHLLVTGRDGQREVQVFVVGTDGSGRRPVTPEGVFAGLQWDSEPVPVTDGRHVAVPSPKGRLTLYPLGGVGEPRELPGLGPGFSAARFSDDGRSLIVVGPETTPTRVYRLDLGSGTKTLLHELAPEDRAGVTTYPSAVVTPDGRGYAYTYRRIFHKLFVAEGLK